MIAMSTPKIPAAPAAAAPATANAQATEVAAGDFLLMLGQLLGAPVAQTGSKPATAVPGDGDIDTETAAEDAAAITGVPVPVVTLPAAQPAQAAEADTAIAAVTTTPKASSAAADATLAKTLLDAANGVDTQRSEAPPGPQQPHLSSDVSQQLRITAAPDPGPTRTLHSTVGSSQWADELSTRMMLMSERGQHSASLRLNPEHLGPLEVRIAVRDDQASVWFGSAHADTRAAIEQALPRLRELFASQGLSLADAGVHHDAPREQSRPSATAAVGDALGGGSSETEVTSVQIAARLGLVDEYV